jgi:hypothetical protein
MRWPAQTRGSAGHAETIRAAQTGRTRFSAVQRAPLLPSCSPTVGHSRPTLSRQPRPVTRCQRRHGSQDRFPAKPSSQQRQAAYTWVRSRPGHHSFGLGSSRTSVCPGRRNSTESSLLTTIPQVPFRAFEGSSQPSACNHRTVPESSTNSKTESGGTANSADGVPQITKPPRSGMSKIPSITRVSFNKSVTDRPDMHSSDSTRSGAVQRAPLLSICSPTALAEKILRTVVGSSGRKVAVECPAAVVRIALTAPAY